MICYICEEKGVIKDASRQCPECGGFVCGEHTKKWQEKPYCLNCTEALEAAYQKEQEKERKRQEVAREYQEEERKRYIKEHTCDCCGRTNVDVSYCEKCGRRFCEHCGWYKKKYSDEIELWLPGGRSYECRCNRCACLGVFWLVGAIHGNPPP